MLVAEELEVAQETPANEGSRSRSFEKNCHIDSFDTKEIGLYKKLRETYPKTALMREVKVFK